LKILDIRLRISDWKEITRNNFPQTSKVLLIFNKINQLINSLTFVEELRPSEIHQLCTFVKSYFEAGKWVNTIVTDKDSVKITHKT
jgi:hypothetical protein